MGAIGPIWREIPQRSRMRAFFEATLMHKVLIPGGGEIGAGIWGLLAEPERLPGPPADAAR